MIDLFLIKGCMGIKTIRNTTPWLSYAAWTWEILRRTPDYVSYYKSLKNKGVETLSLSQNVTLSKANLHYPTANKFGLLAPADPTKYAGEQAVFWCPKSFQSVVRFHVIDPAEVDRKHKPVQLSKFPGEKAHFIDGNGTYHIRILRREFWFQMQCDHFDFVDENAYIGLEINDLENPDKRLKTFKEIAGLYDGSIALDGGLHVPARLDSQQKATLAYDIRTAGGSISDVILAFKQAGFIQEDPDKYIEFTDAAQNAYRAGKAFVSGDYLRILNRQ